MSDVSTINNVNELKQESKKVVNDFSDNLAEGLQEVLVVDPEFEKRLPEFKENFENVYGNLAKLYEKDWSNGKYDIKASSGGMFLLTLTDWTVVKMNNQNQLSLRYPELSVDSNIYLADWKNNAKDVENTLENVRDILKTLN